MSTLTHILLVSFDWLSTSCIYSLNSLLEKIFFFFKKSLESLDVYIPSHLTIDLTHVVVMGPSASGSDLILTTDTGVGTDDRRFLISQMQIFEMPSIGNSLGMITWLLGG